MDPSDAFYRNALNRKTIDGFYDVIGHGSPDSIMYTVCKNSRTLAPEELARVIRTRPDYADEAIRLLSCETGCSPIGFAQRLANEMSKDVLAPSDVLWATSRGDMFIAPQVRDQFGRIVVDQWGRTSPNMMKLGEWRLFRPL